MNRDTRRTVIIPMDHGLTMGPIQGLQDMKFAVNQVAEGGANAVLLHKGIIRAGYRGYGKDIGLIMHLSGSTVLGPDPNDKVLVADVVEAIKTGADAVSVHINIGSKTEPAQLKVLGTVAKTCDEWGMPLLAMVYPRGEKIKNPTKTEEEFCQMVYESIRAGGAGAAVGRNVFQHKHPAKMVRVLCGIVHKGLDVKTALAKYMK